MIEFTFDKRQWGMMQKKFKQLDGLPLLFLRKITNEAENEMTLLLRSGGLLKVRTGRLWNSIQGYVDPSSLFSVVGSGARINAERVKYATIHAVGGIIRPKKAKYLAIPMPEIMQASGGMLRGNEMKPRDFKNTFFYRSRRGNLMLAQKIGKKTRNLFVLKKSVTIPKRDYIGATSEIMQRKVAGIFEESVNKVMA